MKVHFMYRLKKYGTWIKGETEVDKTAKETIHEQVKMFIQLKHPDCSRIEISNITNKV